MVISFLLHNEMTEKCNDRNADKGVFASVTFVVWIKNHDPQGEGSHPAIPALITEGWTVFVPSHSLLVCMPVCLVACTLCAKHFYLGNRNVMF